MIVCKTDLVKLSYISVATKRLQRPPHRKDTVCVWKEKSKQPFRHKSFYIKELSLFILATAFPSQSN